MKKIFLGGYKKMIKKAFSIGICAAFMLTTLPIGRQNFVAESANPTSSEIALTPNANTQTTIPIAMATDNNYTHVTLVSIVSALENADKDTKLKFYIMVPGDFSEDNKRKIQKVNDSFKNGEIEIINMGDSFKECFKGIWAAATYYRLKLHNLLKNEDKCIYLDGDTLVLKDLKDMYNLDINEYYAAGTSVPSEISRMHARRLKKPDISLYIISGVLLMNLAKMREDNIENEFSEILKNKIYANLAYVDQDVINLACCGKLSDLPLKYSVLSSDFKENKNSAIIHYAGFQKPWRQPFVDNTWLKYEQDLIDVLNS